ncbi:hypothetical protein BDY21DRAFT_390133 [Lineolata rhizophorae]|uniref:Uncharacterized protein n=1 Tax=Lineolata rhizophorae TaxID=578093 RepID=A0A6A6PEK1_9PEZI|nr:hypothetical protein BDY21DRAFT_390133 [Lineolata rhizophorae]
MPTDFALGQQPTPSSRRQIADSAAGGSKKKALSSQGRARDRMRYLGRPEESGGHMQTTSHILWFAGRNRGSAAPVAGGCRQGFDKVAGASGLAAKLEAQIASFNVSHPDLLSYRCSKVVMQAACPALARWVNVPWTSDWRSGRGQFLSMLGLSALPVFRVYPRYAQSVSERRWCSAEPTKIHTILTHDPPFPAPISAATARRATPRKLGPRPGSSSRFHGCHGGAPGRACADGREGREPATFLAALTKAPGAEGEGEAEKRRSERGGGN